MRTYMRPSVWPALRVDRELGSKRSWHPCDDLPWVAKV
jgi:hypothetical protein